MRQSPYQSITIEGEDSLTTIHITGNTINTRVDKTYFWFANGKIQSAKGAYSGHLLEGIYQVVDLDGKLLTSGQFRNGIKVGTWRFYEDGNLVRVIDMDRGEKMDRDEEITPNSGFHLFKPQKDSVLRDTTETMTLFKRAKKQRPPKEVTE